MRLTVGALRAWLDGRPDDEPLGIDCDARTIVSLAQRYDYIDIDPAQELVDGLVDALDDDGEVKDDQEDAR